jgi:hypothetical protein
MLTSTRRRLAAVAMVLLVPTLGACGFGYQTDKVYQPGVGVNDRSGTVDVLAAVVVSSTDGEGTLVASLVNKDSAKDDTLVNVTGDGLDVSLSAPLPIPADSLVNLADTGAISVKGETVVPGKFARLKLTFQNGQETEINAPIVPQEAEFSDIKPAAPSDSASPSASPSATP